VELPVERLPELGASIENPQASPAVAAEVTGGSPANVLLVHLSDLHFEGKPLPRGVLPEKVVGAVIERGYLGGPAVVVATGDIVYKGLRDGYAQATEFLDALSAQLREQCSCSSVEIIPVPGNHDCNEALATRSRKNLIKSLIEGKKEFNDAAWQECTMPQRDFFEFSGLFYASSNALSRTLWIPRPVKLGPKQLLFLCFNTSYMYRPGPTEGRPAIVPEYAFLDGLPVGDVTIAVMHHPPHWFEGRSASQLLSAVEAHCHVVLYGHEHEVKTRKLVNGQGAGPYFLQGGIFHLPGSFESCFRLIDIDLDRRSISWSTHNLVPEKTHYQRTEEQTDLPLRSDAADEDAFSPKEAFVLGTLQSLDATIRHPRKGALLLSDVYVMPNLRIIAAQSEADEAALHLVHGEQVPAFIEHRKHVVVCGGFRSGKTALLRALYRALLDKGVTPVLVNGAELREVDLKKLQAVVEKAFASQYSSDVQFITRYNQLVPAKRALLVDNLDQALADPHRRKLLLRAASLFGIIVAAGSDSVLAREATIGAGGALFEATFTTCELARPTLEQCGQLIEKWVDLDGSDASEADYFRRVDELEREVNELLRKRLYPPCPFVVLAALHLRDNPGTVTVGEGSLSTLYKLLIDADLVRSGADADELRTFLSELAYHMFCQSQVTAAAGDLELVGKRVADKYDIEARLEGWVRSLRQVRVLESVGDSIRFTYPLVFHHFLAYYLFRHARDTSEAAAVSQMISRLCSDLGSESAVNTLHFLTSLIGDDPLLISPLLEAVESIFPDAKVADLGKDVAVLNKLVFKPAVPSLPAERSPKLARKERRALLQKLEEAAREEDQEAKESPYTQQSLVAAVLAIQLLCQLLRNNPTTLTAGTKRHVAEVIGVDPVSWTP